MFLYVIVYRFSGSALKKASGCTSNKAAAELI